MYVLTRRGFTVPPCGLFGFYFEKRRVLLLLMFWDAKLPATLSSQCGAHALLDNGKNL